MTSAAHQLRRLMALIIVLASTAALRAQMPVNNPVWKMRCELLAANDSAIASGNAPKELVAATRSVPGSQSAILAFDRADANQHYVACTFLYLAAIAERAGNGGKVDASTADNDLTLARFEVRLAAGQSLGFTEKLSQTKAKMSEKSGHSDSLSSAQTTLVLAAATTMPIVLTPPAAPTRTVAKRTTH